MKLRNPDFKHFGWSIGQVKTWVCLVLGRDPQADQGMGVSRQYSLEEAFKIYVFGRLVAKHRMKLKEAQDLLNNLWPILEREKLIYLYYKIINDIPKITIELYEDMLGTISIYLGKDEQPEKDGWSIMTKKYRTKQIYLKSGPLRAEFTLRLIDLGDCIKDFLKTLGLLQS